MNYGILTWPCKEWCIVVDGDPVPLADRRDNRHIPIVSELLQQPHVVESKLTKPEVIALILYTGPMVRLLQLPKFLPGLWQREITSIAVT